MAIKPDLKKTSIDFNSKGEASPENENTSSHQAKIIQIQKQNLNRKVNVLSQALKQKSIRKSFVP